MSGTNFSLRYNATIHTDVSDLKNAVKQIKLAFDDIEMPKGVTKNFERDLKELEAELQNFSALISQTVEGPKDINQANNSWKKIKKLLGSITIESNELSNISENLFPKSALKNLQQANTLINNYEKKVGKVRENQVYIQKSQDLDSKTKLKEASDKRVIDAEKKLTSARVALAEAERAEELNRQQNSASYQKNKKRASSAKAQVTKAEKTRIKAEEEVLRYQESGVLTKDGQVKSRFDSQVKKAQDRANATRETVKQTDAYSNLIKANKEYSESVRQLNSLKQKGIDKNSEEWKSAEKATEAAKKRRDEALIPIKQLKEEEAEVKKLNDTRKQAVESVKTLKQSQKQETSKKDALKEAEDELKVYEEYENKVEQARKEVATKQQEYNLAKGTSGQFEAEITALKKELQGLEGAGAQEEWQAVANFVKEISGVDLSETTGDLQAVKKALSDYEIGQIKSIPDLLEAIKVAAKDAEQPVEKVTGHLDNMDDNFDREKRAQQDIEHFKNNLYDFFSLTNTVHLFREAVRDAFDTIKELDAVMTETAVVTDFTVGDMWDKLPEYSAQASALGASVTDLYKATTLYYQQGLNSEQAMSVGVETMKMARIANMDAAESTEAMTAALRGFNMAIDEDSARKVNDVYSELAAITAADTSQIATAMTKTASIANSANMEFETTAALLAQIIETTQEAPETAGTAMKTIIARFTEVKELFDEGQLTGEDSEGESIDINKIDTALKTVGISLADFLNGTKGIDDIFLELAEKWDTLDLATQRYIATTAAGSRQQSRFIAMMSDYDRTMELVGAAKDSIGASDNQFNKTLDSLDAKLQKLANSWHTFVMGITNSELVKGGVDILSGLLDIINTLTGFAGSEGVGGLATSFLRLLVAIGALKGGKSILDGFFDSFKEVSGEAKKGAISSIFKTILKVSKDLSKPKGIGDLLSNMEAGFEGVGSSLKDWSTDAVVSLTNLGASIQNFTKVSIKDFTGFFKKLAGAGSLTNGIKMIFSTFLGKITLVVGALVALWKVGEFIYSISPAGQLESAQEEADEAKKAAQEAADSYNNLNSSLESISQKSSSLDSLVTGTQEWRDAVQELNAEILETVQNYPELGALLGRDSNGRLYIKEKSDSGLTKEEVLQEYSKEKDIKQAEDFLAQAQILSKQERVDFADLSSGTQFLSAEGPQSEANYLATREVAKAIAEGTITSSDQVKDFLQNKYETTLVRLPYNFDFLEMMAYGQQLLSNEAATRNYSGLAFSSLTSAAGIEGAVGDLFNNLDTDLGLALYRSVGNSETGYIKKIEEISESLRDDDSLGLYEQLLSNDGQDITEDTIKGFLKDNGAINTKEVSDIAGKISGLFGIKPDIAKNHIESAIEIAKERIAREQSELIANMSLYGGGDRSFVNSKKILNEVKSKGEWATTSLQDLFTYMTKSEDTNLVSKAYQVLTHTILEGTEQEVKEINDLITGINWSNPIEAANKLQKELEYGSGASRDFAYRMSQVDSSFLSASSQMQYFFSSEDWEEMGEEVDELIEANNELSATDLIELTKDNKLLNDLLETTGLNAAAAGRLIQQMAEHKLSVDQLTDSVLSAISAFGGLEGMTAETLDTLANFDLGIDENQASGYIKQYYDILKNNMDKGAIGNTQNFRILDLLFGPDWDAGLEGDTDALYARMLALTKQLGENAENMKNSWGELADLAASDGEVQAALGDLKVTRDWEGGIDLTGFEDMSIDEITSRIAEAYNVSKKYAELMLIDFKNSSLELAPALNEKYFEQAVDNLVESASEKGYLNQSEIEAIAEFFGKQIDEVKGIIGDGIHIFEDVDAETDSVADLRDKIHTLYKETRGGGILSGLESDEGSFNMAVYRKRLESLGLGAETVNQLIEQVAQEYDIIKDKMPDGNLKEISKIDGLSYQESYANQVEAHKQQQLIDSFWAGATGEQTADINWINVIEPLTEEQLTASGTINWEIGTVTYPDNTNSNTSNGTSEASGTAMALGGNYGNAKGGKTLVGEIKREMVVDPHSGRWYTVGDHGAEFVDLPKDAIVFNHRQTDQILKNGHIFSRGKSYASGNAFVRGYEVSSKSSGGRATDKDEQKNNIDKLYNLVRNIEEEQRQRERIERRYEKLLESIDASAQKIIDVSQEQINQLKLEKKLQEELVKGRKEQIKAYQKEQELTEYAWTEQNQFGEEIIRINWDLINSLDDKEEIASIEEYLGQLEEWVDAVNQAEDDLKEIEDTLEEIKSRGEDEYFDLEEKIKDAIVHAREEEIEQLEEINESISDTNSDILDAIQRSIERQRQERDNQKTEEELLDKQRRLAYLSMDTSGANDLEIKELREELFNETEDYTDTLIDQKISQLQEQNERANEQRQWQIELAQKQLDQYVESGEVWNEVYKLMDEGLDKDSGLIRGSRLEEILRNEANFEGLSKIGQLDWWKEFNTLVAQGLGYLELGRQLEDLRGQEGIPGVGELVEFYKDGKFYTGVIDEEGNVKVGDEVFNNVYQGYDGRFYAGENYEVIEPEVEEPEVEEVEEEKKEDKKVNKAAQQWWEENQYVATVDGENFYGSSAAEAEKKAKEYLKNDVLKDHAPLPKQAKIQILEEELSKIKAKKQYKTGGLADFTGPAWLDGTRSRPEYVLNAAQTQGFLRLVNILDSLNKTSSFNSQIVGGDTFDIDINIETVKEEADIDMLTEKIQKSIVSTSRYRSNNFVKR